MKIVLAKPFSLDEESDGDYKVPNVVQRILSLLKHVRPGTDLTSFQLPPLFNIPKSNLQIYAELVYSSRTNLLSRCSRAETSLDRFIAVLVWTLSTNRPTIYGVAPYNPTLGETHHISSGSLNVLLEQISHHPAVSALHATDEKENLEIIWSQRINPKFHGTLVESDVSGKRELKLHGRGETYEMNAPKFVIRFLPVPRVDWVGNAKIRCQESGLEADLCYGSTSFLGLGGNPRSIKGKIYETLTKKTLYEIYGHWDRIVKVKDIRNGNVTVIYDAKENLSGLKTPIVKDLEGIWPSEATAIWSEVSEAILSKDWGKAREATAIWSEVSEAILSKDWGKAREAKKEVEETQRELLKQRESRGEIWVPKHFVATRKEDGEWDCSPIQGLVPPAPIIVPL